LVILKYVCTPNFTSMYTVTYKFEQKGLEPITLLEIEDGQSLLEVALKNDINLHHNCGGVCACSTCHLYVEQGDDLLEELNDREEDFIDRAVNPRINSRLGCQCVLLEGDGDIIVTLPDQSQFLGE
jgi:ferredoxin, 2Fe-2S